MNDNSSATVPVKDISLPLFTCRGWLKFLGVLSIVYGVLSALTIIGLIIAWLPIWLGVLLFQTATRIEIAYYKEDAVALEQAMYKVRLYFVIFGVISLIGLILIVLSLFMPLAMLGSMGHFT